MCYEDTGRKKPSTLPFRKALKKLKVLPSESIYVGDWPEQDIIGAKRVGMKTAWAKYSKQEERKEVRLGKKKLD